MRKSIAAAVIAASAATGACGRMHHENAGATVSRSYQVGSFQQIDTAGPYDVQVRTGGSRGVSAQGPQKLIDQAVVEVRGDTLMIHPQDNHNSFSWNWGSHRRAIFTVTVPQLSAATLAGSGDLDVDNVKGDQFTGKLAGSGDLTIDSANVQSLKLSLGGSGDAKVGSGDVQSGDYSIVGSGDVDARGVRAQQLKVSIAGSGDVDAQATGMANVSIMGSGDVSITGGAKCNVSKAGSGDVHCS